MIPDGKAYSHATIKREREREGEKKVSQNVDELVSVRASEWEREREGEKRF